MNLMKVCPACSKEFHGNEKFCSRDGTPLKEAASDPKVAPASEGFPRSHEPPDAGGQNAHSRLEAFVRESLDKRFRQIAPGERPWYAANLLIAAGPNRSKVIPFLIVSPNQITAAHVVEAQGIDAGIVHGDPNLKEWFIETADGKRHRLEISGANPFEGARQALNFLLPNLDRFLHSRGIKNPFVHSVLAFSDAYSLEGVRDAQMGPHSRGAVVLVKAGDLPEAALFTTHGQKLDPVVFRQWLEGIIPGGGGSLFKETWLDVPSEKHAAPRMEKPPPREPARETPSPAPDHKLKEWIIEEAEEDEEPSIIDLEDEDLIEREKHYRTRSRQPRAKTGRRKTVLAVTTILALLIVTIVLWLIYEYKRPLTLPSYLQQSATASAPESEPASFLEEPPAAPPSGDSEQLEPPARETVSTRAEKTDARMAAKEPPVSEDASPGSVPSISSPAAPSVKRPELPAPLPDKIDVKRPAPTGPYETIRPTVARRQPDASAAVVDRIGSGTKLNVVGSDGDWLVVQSRTRNSTVYVNRDDAMMIAEKKAGSNVELKWKEVELQIQEAILRRGVPDITVSFIGDTVFLKGTVRTEQQSQAAELAAKTIPEVTHVHNGIWVRP